MLSINHFNPSFLFVGNAFAENSSSTSLQRVAARRVVSLSSGYFLQNSGDSAQGGTWIQQLGKGGTEAKKGWETLWYNIQSIGQADKTA